MVIEPSLKTPNGFLIGFSRPLLRLVCKPRSARWRELLPKSWSRSKDTNSPSLKIVLLLFVCLQGFDDNVTSY